ncbi:MAG: helix-turn-helix transcriptional regulator [Desulfuromonadaceae bacterium]|nr:helix-turn-helix transcriptional regulator [Desulfuromonadaceae bacterium]
MADREVFMARGDGTVMVDGDVARRLREEQNLTQLYVAKVVGVTTDTISRWENNRYPTIKRQNAERLAEALEVPLEALIRSSGEGEEAPSAACGSFFRWWMVWVILAVLLALVAVWYLLVPPSSLQAQRLLPSYVAPGAVFPVRLRIDGTSQRIVVREVLPPGWQLVGAEPVADSYDQKTGLVRWMLSLNGQPQWISYLVAVSATAPLGQLQAFGGEVVAHATTDRERVGFLGADQLVIARVHWADLDGNLLIDDDEILEAAAIAEGAPRLAVDLDKVESLWVEEGYHWDDPRSAFVPGKSTNSP